MWRTVFLRAKDISSLSLANDLSTYRRAGIWWYGVRERRRHDHFL